MQGQKYSFLVVLLTMLSICSYGQDTKSTYQKSQMARDLELDTTTPKQFDSINKSFISETYALKIKSNSKKNLKKLNALEQKRDRELQILLTKDQFETYVELRRQQRENMRSLIRKKQ